MIDKVLNGKSRGLGIVEVVFSVLLVGGVLVAALHSVGAATKGRQFGDSRARGQLLAEHLMTEILAQAYRDEDNLGTMGLETSETVSNRRQYDDVDDYRNYIESPPGSRDGTLLDGFDGWSRQVSVVLSDPVNPNAIPTTDKGLKRITITVRRNNARAAVLTAFKPCTDPVAGNAKSQTQAVDEDVAIVFHPSSPGQPQQIGIE